MVTKTNICKNEAKKKTKIKKNKQTNKNSGTYSTYNNLIIIHDPTPAGSLTTNTLHMIKSGKKNLNHFGCRYNTFPTKNAKIDEPYKTSLRDIGYDPF